MSSAGRNPAIDLARSAPNFGCTHTRRTVDIMSTELPLQTIRRIATDAYADPRTTEKVLRGGAIRGRALRERILDSARLHGVELATSQGRGRSR
jgi:hypothetical protein